MIDEVTQGGSIMKKPKGLQKYLAAAIMAGMHIDPFLFKPLHASHKKKKKKHDENLDIS